MEKDATLENKKRSRASLQEGLEKELENEPAVDLTHAPKKPKLERSNLIMGPVHFDFGNKKLPVEFDKIKELLIDQKDTPFVLALRKIVNSEEESTDEVDSDSNEEEATEESDNEDEVIIHEKTNVGETHWKKKKITLRDKDSLSREEKMNCSYSYGINKNGHLYRILRDAFGVIINRSYQLLKGLHLDAVSYKCFGEKKGRKWEARRSLTTDEFLTNSFKYLDEEKK